VTSIGNYAFQNCTKLVSVALPLGTTSVGVSAFQDCTGLVSILIPPSVTEILDSAFFGCANLKSIALPSGLSSISKRAFAGCKSLSSAVLPNKLVTIDDYAFYRCSSLASAALPPSLLFIGSYAFASCSSLSVASLISTQSIGNNAFQSTGLKEVAVPASVTSIGNYGFSDLQNLSSVSFASCSTILFGVAPFYLSASSSFCLSPACPSSGLPTCTLTPTSTPTIYPPSPSGPVLVIQCLVSQNFQYQTPTTSAIFTVRQTLLHANAAAFSGPGSETLQQVVQCAMSGRYAIKLPTVKIISLIINSNDILVLSYEVTFQVPTSSLGDTNNYFNGITKDFMEPYILGGSFVNLFNFLCGSNPVCLKDSSSTAVQFSLIASQVQL